MKMDEYREIIQTLNRIKSDTDAIVENATKAVHSPEMQHIMEMAERVRNSLPVTMMHIAEAVAPYAELAQRIAKNVEPALIALGNASMRLSVIDRLGKAEYVIWHSFPKSFYEEAYKTKSESELLDFVYEYLKVDNFSEITETITYLEANDYLKDNRVFAQSINAYRQEQYDIAALGLTAMIDRLLSVYSGRIKDVNIKRRAEAIMNKVDEYGEASLDEIEVNDYFLLSTFSNALNIFGSSSDFDKEEPNLNRHWIAHGRMNRNVVKIDCIRLINFLYGTILMSRLAE